ncbi:K02A2.6-like [Cordylochernes scorpioides]|uniref:RNA-directed DNA polymerase n=1 Tax=Cordylochernes scorpioides TaxID=51811 RepID=A0ABY6KCK5_9ARAC|nr:K02A2.6-like [Cordylochernes scorpioides]
MRDDLVAFIRRSPTVSFTGTDALGLGREEVLDLLSSRTKAQRKRWLLTPPQTDALAGLIKQILGLKPAGNTNVYKILHQVKSELKKGPAAVPPTPPLPAPWPAEPAPPAPQERESTPAMATRCDELRLLTIQLMKELNLWPQLDTLYPDLVEAVLCPEDRKGFLRRLFPEDRKAIIQILDKLSEHTRDLHSLTLRDLSELRAALPSPGPAGQEPGRPSILSPTGGKNSLKNELHREISRENSANKDYANPPSGYWKANLAAARGDVTTGSAAATSSNGAARALRNWADCPEDQGPGADDDFTVVRTKKRRRESANSPTAAAPSSNIGGARTSRRLQSSAGSVPRAQEVRTTRAQITEARAWQASSTEDHCVYLEHGPELQPFHYLRALDRMFGGTAGVIQVSKVNGHQLLGLANRGLAERLINEGLEVEGTLLRAFPFRKRAERITVGNLPFFVEDSAIISALKPYGRVTSIAPKLTKAGPYTYNDGRREAFIALREGMTTERLPTRLEIPIKGEAWPAYLSSGIKCSRANQRFWTGHTYLSHRRPFSDCAWPGLPQQPSAQPPPSASPSPTMELSDVPPASRAALLPPAAPRPPPPAPLALPVEDTSPAPPPAIPAPSLRAPGGSVSPQSTKSGPPAQDIEMTDIEESSASSTSSSRTSMRDDLVAFIRRSPTVSFTGTDALGLGREEVLDLLSSRTKAQRKRWLLTPPQTDALAGLIKQILGLKPAGNTNVYKILHQVKSELKKGPAAVPPTPPLPAPWPAEPAPPAPQERESTPAMATRCDELQLLTIQLMKELNLWPQLDSLYPDLVEAVLYPEDRKGFLRRLSPGDKKVIIQILDKLSEHTRDLHSLTLRDLSEFRAAFPFVAGIIDTSTQKKLLQEEKLTFDGALDIALSAESADHDLHNIKGSENAHQSPQHLHAINNTCKHCDRSFNSCKNALDETTCLSHYSLNLPLILSCDASQVGIGATLSHLKDGEERPVCFISRTLNVHERKYSQVEREGLAIVFAVNKLKNYLFGRKFTIYTDHKPLITIFGDKTNLPPLIANRLHRWALTLSNFSFEIKYKKGKDNIIPDFLSRFPEFQESNLEYNDGSGEILLLNTFIIDHVLVAHETQLDRTLFKLYKIIETGELPSSPNDDLIPYLKRIDDFTILQKCIFLENRMVIPKSLHERVLQLLHESHAGTNKMKMMARSSIWWPGMDSSIEIITKNCRTCLSNESLPPQRTESWPKYAGPWRRVHMDYFNFKNKLFLLAVDSFSSWVEVSEVPSTSAYFCINFMRNCIARYGFPQVVVSDNGPPFFSSDFGDFLSKNGISHVTSPPYHPKSNGQAEVSVREVKKLLKKQLYENEQVELDLALSRALFFIRTDVNIRKGTSPAELFLGRKIRSRLSVLSKEEVKVSKVNGQYVNSKFKVDETVKFRWITNGHPSWYTGKKIKILGRNVYLIKQGDSKKKVHQNYIKKMLPGKSHPTNMNDAERVPTPISEEKSVTTPRYPQRERRCPQRYGE